MLASLLGVRSKELTPCKPSGADKLSSHVNQTVRVTGEAKGKTFTAKSVDYVAATCSSGKKE